MDLIPCCAFVFGERECVLVGGGVEADGQHLPVDEERILVGPFSKSKGWDEDSDLGQVLGHRW